MTARYEDRTEDDPLARHFADAQLDLSSGIGKSVFDTLYAVMCGLCQSLFEFIQDNSPDALSGQTIEQEEFSDLEAVFATDGNKWFPPHEANIVYAGLGRLRRGLRNRVEHRSTIIAEDLRSIATDAGNVLSIIGHSETAKNILQIRRDFTGAMSKFNPQVCPSRPIDFLRRTETPGVLE